MLGGFTPWNIRKENGENQSIIISVIIPVFSHIKENMRKGDVTMVNANLNSNEKVLSGEELLTIQREIAKLTSLAKKQKFPMGVDDFRKVKDFMVKSAETLDNNKLYIDMALAIYKYLARVSRAQEKKGA